MAAYATEVQPPVVCTSSGHIILVGNTDGEHFW